MIPRKSAPAAAGKNSERHPIEKTASRCLRSVEVSVGIEPDGAQLGIADSTDCSNRGNAVPREDHRKGAACNRSRDRSGETSIERERRLGLGEKPALRQLDGGMGDIMATRRQSTRQSRREQRIGTSAHARAAHPRVVRNAQQVNAHDPSSGSLRYSRADDSAISLRPPPPHRESHRCAAHACRRDRS